MPDKEKSTKKNVFYLGMVSLFTDLSSQMIYPLIPEFLISLGASKFIIGIIEGVAESIAAIFRSVFGKWSDKIQKRKIFIYFGYGFSAISKPFLFIAGHWGVVFAVKLADRTGKAMRTPARDALLASSVSSKKKGQAFGFHRAMDRLGAIGGPLLALLVLSRFEGNVRLVFLLSAIPALLALVFILFTKEKSFQRPQESSSPKESVLKNWPLRIFIFANVLFALGNSSNVFLILKAREAGLSIALIPVIWVVYNIFCTISSPIFGTLSDKVGRRPIISISFLFYSLLYFLFGISSELLIIWILFAAYGIYYGLSEGVYRAYIADLVPEENRATAYGIFNTAIGLALFPASLIMGSVWDQYGSQTAFHISALFSLIGFLVFYISSKVIKPLKILSK